MLIPEPVIEQPAEELSPMPETARSPLSKQSKLSSPTGRRGSVAQSPGGGRKGSVAQSPGAGRRGSVVSAAQSPGGKRSPMAKSPTSRRGSMESVAASAASAEGAPKKPKQSPRPLIAELLKFKDRLQQGMACLFANPSQAVLDIAFKILPAAIQRNKEFVNVFSNYSITWPIADIIIQTDRDNETR
eukprot:3680585-Rhodomonas_salina.1